MAASAAALDPPRHLRVEGLHQGAAIISEARPRFSFLHGAAPSGFGVTQASFRITVTDADADDATSQHYWDSGLVKSSNCSQIEYGGDELKPFTRYDWTVSWTSSAGDQSPPASARFETGLLTVADWHGAGWLPGYADKTQARNTFSLPHEDEVGQPLAFVRAYVSSAGCAHVEVNGQVPQVDLRGLCPWPVNSLSVRYVTHDITSLVSAGSNAIGIISGSVMHGPQTLVLVVAKFRGSPPTILLSSLVFAKWLERRTHPQQRCVLLGMATVSEHLL